MSGSHQSEESKKFELEELENYDFCCKELKRFTTNLPYKFVRYFPERRIFGIREGPAYSCMYNQIFFCPWCSRYLGEPIGDQYNDYVEELELEDENQNENEDYVSTLEMTLERKKEWVKHYKEREKANSAEPVSAKEKD